MAFIGKSKERLTSPEQDPLHDLSGYMKIGGTGDATAQAYLDCKYTHKYSVHAGLTSIWY